MTDTPDTLKIALYGVPRLLDYLPPKGATLAECAPGTRVLVEVGKRQRMGLVMQHAPSAWPVDKVKACLAIADKRPVVDKHMLQLLIWSSDYYFCDPGTAMHAFLPKGIRDAATEDFASHWQLDGQKVAAHRKPSKAQQQAINLFAAHQGKLDRQQLAAIHPHTRKKLFQAGIVCPIYNGSTAQQPVQTSEPVRLNDAQKKAIQNISAAENFCSTLLYGITGSGKTQVYLALVQRTLEQGKQALVLVPEIGLTPQTLARFTHHFAGHIAVVHSALSEKERENTWHNAKNGAARLIIGTRSAIFSPCPRLGLIVVDEEHDSSFKQQSGFRYNARDLAIVRAQMHDCPVVLGSATPQLATLHRVEQKKFALTRLKERATTAPVPEITLLDMRQYSAKTFLAPQALEAIERQLQRGKQALVFLNRRGFSPLLQCRSCGWQAMCHQCDSRMTLHQHPSGLMCHHCGERQSIPLLCPQCHNKSLHTLGSGTQHIAGHLQKRFPTTPIVRIDRDSLGSGNQIHQLLGDMSKRKPVILVGTQMLAKGHDFAHLGLVVVVEADNGLFSSDFRAPEVTMQLLVQVAGRAGRSNERGQVYIQTAQPEADCFQLLLQNDYDLLAALLLQERRTYQLPPYSTLILMRARHKDQQRLRAFMQLAERQLRQLTIHLPHLRLFGPAPPAIGKLAGVWREQVLLFHPNRTVLHQLCKKWHSELKRITPACHWYFDVDPYEVT